MKNIYIFITIMISVLFYLMFSSKYHEGENILYVYSWANSLPDKVIEKFEKETNIKVIMSFYDSNEALESKLIMRNSGYDVVFPSALPFAKRQIELGVYEKINKKEIPNLKYINTKFIKEVKSFDKNMDYFIPQVWGTIGFMYNEKELSRLLGDNKINNALDFYKIENLKNISKCGVSMLSEPGEFIPFLMLYLGYDINSEDRHKINDAINYGIRIRKYIKQFQTFKATEDLYSGEICAALVWSGQYIKLLQKIYKSKNKDKQSLKIKYLTPKSVTPFWLDGIAIPKNALHKKHAHKFINFMLHPNIAAMISESLLEYSTIPKSSDFFRDFARKNLSYSDKMLENLTMIKVQSKAKNRQLINGMRKIIIGSDH